MTAPSVGRACPRPPPATPALPRRASFVFAVLVMGATALIGQVVLARELLSLFFGNELSIALVLAVWLVAVAAGSAAGSRVAARVHDSWQALAYSQLLVAMLLPLSLVIARRVPPPSARPGEVLGPGAMLLTSLETLGLVAAASGLQFVLAALAAQGRGASTRREAPLRRGALTRTVQYAPTSPAAAVFALEAAGATAAGLVFHFFLGQSMGPRTALAAFGCLNVCSALALIAVPQVGNLRHKGLALSLAVAIGLGLLWVLSGGRAADLAGLRASTRWSELNPVALQPSKYGELVITSRQGQIALYQSGVLLFTSQDEEQNEITAHLPLLEHPHPGRVLLIGAAGSGLPGEILKHHIEHLDCVELDPRVTDLARRWMPASLTRALADPRVAVHHGDGRAFVRKARSRYDVILLSLPDPTTAAINRFYTEDFFREAERALAPGGLLSLGLTGSEIHLSGFVLLSAATLDQTLATVFPDRLLVPGDRMLFLAAERPGCLTSDWQLLCDRLFSRRIQTHFVNDVWLRDSLFPFRGDLLRQQLAQVSHPRTNTDLNPVSYYYQTGIWLDRLSSSLAAPARLLSHVSLWWGLALVPLALLLAILGRGPRAAGAAVLVAVACIGGFELVVELLCLLVFQSACGYLYHAIGILIAAFMAGLALGAAALRGRRADARGLGRLLLAGLATAALASLALPRLLDFALQAPGLAPFLLGLLLLLTGSLGGAFFPIATARYLRTREGAPPDGRQASSAAGAAYAADVLGSAGAGLFAGAFAIPLLGVSGTCYGLALVLAAAAVLALPLAIRR